MTPPAVAGVRCELLSDAAYGVALRRAVQTAQRRCLCTMFIVDLTRRTAGDEVGELVDHLADARWRGVDVRVLIGGSRSTFAIAEAAGIARAHLAAIGVPSRWLTATRGVRGSHAKTVIADETVLLGSHNWSPGALGDETQDSVRAVSPALAGYLAAHFERRWGDAHE